MFSFFFSSDFPEEALKGLEIFYSKRANERDYIEETVIAGKQDGMTLQNVKAYREKLKLGKKKKEEKQSSTSYSESSDYDYSCSNDGDDDISDLYSSGDDEDEDEDEDEEDSGEEDIQVSVEYNKLKVTELKAIAEAKGLTNYKSLKKQPLIDLIKASE